MELRGNFLSKWNFAGILFGGLLARIAKYLLNGSPRELKFHTVPIAAAAAIAAAIALTAATVITATGIATALSRAVVPHSKAESRPIRA
jgi:hypothetical protein